MKSLKSIVVGAVMVLTITSCGLTPETLKNAVIGHQTFPSLAIAVQECISDRPDVQEAITPAWNRTFDKWAWIEENDIKPDANLLKTLVGSPSKLAEAERDALFIEAAIIDAGLDCGTFVRTQWGNIKVTFAEIKTAAASSQKFVAVVEYSTLLSAILQGRQVGEVARMPTLPATE